MAFTEQPGGGLNHLFDGAAGSAGGDGDLVLFEDFLGLVFVEVHSSSEGIEEMTL